MCLGVQSLDWHYWKHLVEPNLPHSSVARSPSLPLVSVSGARAAPAIGPPAPAAGHPAAWRRRGRRGRGRRAATLFPLPSAPAAVLAVRRASTHAVWQSAGTTNTRPRVAQVTVRPTRTFSSTIGGMTNQRQHLYEANYIYRFSTDTHSHMFLLILSPWRWHIASVLTS